MREFVFTIEYEHGADPVMDVFIEYPETRARTLSCHVSRGNLWRIDRIVGPSDALDRLDDIFMDPVHCNECIGERHCHTDWVYEILAADSTGRTVYTYQPKASDCHSVPHLATCYFGDGVVCRAERREDRYVWRLLLREDGSVREMYDALVEELRDGLSVNFEQIGAPSPWVAEARSTVELPYEQRIAVEAAVEHGYYQTPRAISMAELADRLDVPRSTLQYRLQRAESWIVSRFVGDRIADETGAASSVSEA